MAAHTLAWLASAGLLALARGSWRSEEEEDHRGWRGWRAEEGEGSRRRHGRSRESDRLDISPLEVEQHQEKWAQGIMALGRLLETHSLQEARHEAEHIVEALYGDDFSNVVVKPTGVNLKPFRNTPRGVVSWLVGHDPQYPQDEGFAARRWRKIEFNNAGISKVGDQALAMGHAHFTGQSGRKELITEFTMGFIRNHDNKVTLNLHFSSIPFHNGTDALRSDRITEDEVKHAQSTFVNDVVRVGQTRRFREMVEMFVDSTFAFAQGDVLFKPPGREGEAAFRSTRFGVYSYFGGGSEDYPHVYASDEGFARFRWIHGSFDNAGIVLDKHQAWAVGTYSFLRDDGRFEAHYSIGYARDSLGRLRINLFAASTPNEVRRVRRRVEECFGGSEISSRAIEEAQKAWAEGIVDIGSTYAIKGDYKRRAEEFVDRMYAYQTRPVLYKPADAIRFRTSRAGAVSYFVGGDETFPEDKGFALKGWEHVHFTNVDAIFTGDEAVTMGYVSYASSSGVWRTAQIAMGFMEDERGALRINMQHASFPERSKTWSASQGSLETRRGHVPQLTKRGIESVQKRWGEWLVRVGQADRNWTRARQLAGQMVDELYDFAGGQVLFKVIEATNSTRFRFTRRGMLSFFVGADCAFPADRGFALEQPWSKVRFENQGLTLLSGGNRAHAFGITSFCCYRDGSELEVQFAAGYVVDSDSSVRIFLHDLSRPFEEESNSWANVALGSVGSAVRAVTRVGGEASEGVSSGTVIALLGAAAVAGLFAYFACCWSCMHKGARRGFGGGHVDYGYDDDLGLGYDPSPGVDAVNTSGRAGMYSRAGAAGGYGVSYQYDQVQSQSYARGAYGNFSAQPPQSRRSMVPSQQMVTSQPHRGAWRTSGSVPQRMYS